MPNQTQPAISSTVPSSKEDKGDNNLSISFNQGIQPTIPPRFALNMQLSKPSTPKSIESCTFDGNTFRAMKSVQHNASAIFIFSGPAQAATYLAEWIWNSLSYSWSQRSLKGKIGISLSGVGIFIFIVMVIFRACV